MPYDVSGESGCEGCQCIKSGCTGITSLVDVNGCVRPSILPKEILRVKYLILPSITLEYGRGARACKTLAPSWLGGELTNLLIQSAIIMPSFGLSE